MQGYMWPNNGATTPHTWHWFVFPTFWQDGVQRTCTQRGNVPGPVFPRPERVCCGVRYAGASKAGGTLRWRTMVFLGSEDTIRRVNGLEMGLWCIFGTCAVYIIHEVLFASSSSFWLNRLCRSGLRCNLGRSLLKLLNPKLYLNTCILVSLTFTCMLYMQMQAEASRRQCSTSAVAYL
jgi:hypothetical protein